MKSFLSAAGFTLAAAALSLPPTAAAAPDNSRGMALLAAHVLSDGTLVRESGVTAAANPSSGVYDVTFDRDIADCLYTTAPIFSDVFVNVVSLSGTNGIINKIRLNTRDAAGAFSSASFHMIVFCPK